VICHWLLRGLVFVPNALAAIGAFAILMIGFE
jgi:hypothetical protein